MHRDDGFTLVEALIALGIIFGVVLMLLRTVDSGVRVVVESRRQAAASALASELVERARSLEWEHMGLSTTANGSTCPDQVGCADTLALFPEITTGPYAFDGEPIVFATGQTFDPFLQFHQTLVRDDTTFDRYLFVTSVRDDPADPETERYRRITAIVRWAAHGGFQREHRLVTYVSQFSEPSQPLITGEIAFDGGFAAFDGWIAGSAGLAIGPLPQGMMSALVTFPDARVRATSDYVSSASVRVEGMSAQARVAGTDGTFNTADDTVAVTEANVFEQLADDDATSAVPLNWPPTLGTLPLFSTSAGAGRAYEHGTSDQVSFTAESWTKHDPIAGLPYVDGLPYAQLALDAADGMSVEREEYDDATVRALYATDSDSGVQKAVTLAEPSYTFTFVDYGDSGPSLEYDGTVDRYTDGTTKRRKTTVSFTWDGSRVRLLNDDIYNEAIKPDRFDGWVIIDLPSISDTSPLEAGEDAWASPAIAAGDDLTISVWNPPTKKYVTVFSSYNSIACSTTPTSVVIDDGAGGPLVWDISPSDAPQLHYEVQGQLDVFGACVDPTTTYASGEIAANQMYATSIVGGVLHYKVVDTHFAGESFGGSLFDGTLYDFVLSFDVGGVTATAVYVNPELAP